MKKSFLLSTLKSKSLSVQHPARRGGMSLTGTQRYTIFNSRISKVLNKNKMQMMHEYSTRDRT
jgi:hypothetical protein